MKKILFTSAAAALLAGAAFAAPVATSDITVTGTVVDTCTMSLTAGAVTNATAGIVTVGAPATPGTGTVTITNLANDTTAVRQAWSAAYTLVGMCNYAHSVGLRSLNGGMTNTGAPAVVGGTFDRRAPYSATIAAWPTSRAITATGTLDDSTATEVKTNWSLSGAYSTGAGGTTLTLAGSAGANPLVAGTFSDTLRVQIGAAI